MIKKSFWTTLASLFYAINSLATNKLFSLYFGPQGVTLLAHFQNMVAIFTTIPSDGINRGVIKFLSDPHESNQHWNKYISAAILLNLVSFSGVFIFMALSFHYYRTDFPDLFFTVENVLLLTLSVFLHLCALIFINLILVKQKAFLFSILSIVNNILGLVLIFWGLKSGMITAFIYLSFAPSSILILIIFTYVKLELNRLRNFAFVFNKKAIIQLSKFILIALSLVVFGRITDFFVRAFVIEKFDLYQTGLWQGVVKMSDGYSNVFNAALGTLIYVKISSLINHPDELKTFIRKSLLAIFVVSVSGLLLVWIFRNEFLTLLYNKDFANAARYIDYQLLGDAFKFPSYILAYLLLARLKTKIYIVTQAMSCAFYILLICIFIPLTGLDGLPLAHFIRFVFFFIMLVWVNRKLIF